MNDERPRRRTTRDDEFRMQAMFFNAVLDHGALRDLPIYAVPNFSGHYGTPLQRVIAGGKANKAGRRKGVPDVIVDVARHPFHGLRIEFKVDGAKPAPEQDDWHNAMRVHGYAVVVCTATDEALDLLFDYVHGGDRVRLFDQVCEIERAARTQRRERRQMRADHKSDATAQKAINERHRKGKGT
jgi:hypothetical protein